MLWWKWKRKISAANQRKGGDLGGLKVRSWIWIKYMIFIFSQVQTTKNESISTRIPAGWPSSFELWVDFEDPEGLWALQWKPTENRVTTSHPLRRLGFYLWCFNWKKHEKKNISKMSRTFPSSKESSESWNSFHSRLKLLSTQEGKPFEELLGGNTSWESTNLSNLGVQLCLGHRVKLRVWKPIWMSIIVARESGNPSSVRTEPFKIVQIHSCLVGMLGA